jgi:DNA-binding response OmpR family regulator
MAGEKILDIDDSPTVQRLIEMILASQGYKVILASDGEEGIAKARSERPAVILVDFVMPKMNGFQVCKILKEDPDFHDTPIILVTSKGDKVGSKFVDALGITDFFTKPFQPDELLGKIRDVINKRKTAPLQPPPLPERERESRPAVLSTPPDTAPSSAGIEAIVRSVVAQMFDVFVKTKLPEIIHQELVKAHRGEVTAGIQGNLASVRIAEVMQLLGLQQQTGRVVINSPGDAVEIYFKDGLVVLASANCNGSRTAVEALLKQSCRINGDSLRHVLSVAERTSQPIDRILVREKMIDQKTFTERLRRHTESAVYKVMDWKDGDFYFEKTTSPVFAVPIQIKVDDLLLEGARRSDEWNLIQKKIPDFTMVFEPMIGNADELASRGMSDIDLKVFSLVNGSRTVRDIIETLNLDDFDVAKSLFILLSVNLIRKKR